MTVDPAARAYIDAIGPTSRPLYDRIHRLILEVAPSVEVVMSYKMPTYRAADRGLHVAAWAHGVSLYGWDERRDGGFVTRHPQLSSGKGTLRLRPSDADLIADDELRTLISGALLPPG